MASPSLETAAAGHAEHEAATTRNDSKTDRGTRLDAAAPPPPFRIAAWDRKMFLSDFIAEGLAYLKERNHDAGHVKTTATTTMTRTTV
jgi:hypothetical protein